MRDIPFTLLAFIIISVASVALGLVVEPGRQTRKRMLGKINMNSRIFSIAIASTFLMGVAAWFGARFWTFGRYDSISIAFYSALAITLAVLVVRGNVFYGWIAVAICARTAYLSFRLYFYLNSKGTPGGAYLLPGVVFSVCSVALFAFLLINHQRNRRNIQMTHSNHSKELL